MKKNEINYLDKKEENIENRESNLSKINGNKKHIERSDDNNIKNYYFSYEKSSYTGNYLIEKDYNIDANNGIKINEEKNDTKNNYNGEEKKENKKSIELKQSNINKNYVD